MSSTSSNAMEPLSGALVKVPRHVAIIMDGNGRWAQARGLPRTAGHRAGVEALREVLEAAVDLGVPMLTVFAFSTENWSRPQPEVWALMQLLRYFLDRELDKLHANGVRLQHIGRQEELDPDLVERILKAQRLTEGNTRLHLNIAFNYGGRADIVDAVRRIIAEGLLPEAVDEAAVAARLSTTGLPDPDLVIRTAGEMRLSNFLIWQAAYAEYYSTPTYWPDFGRDELYRALLAYQQRDRRYGGLAPTR